MDIVKLMTQIRAKYKAACATVGVRPRLVGATLGGDVAQGSVEERPGGGAPVKKQVWKFEKAVKMAGPGGAWVLKLEAPSLPLHWRHWRHWSTLEQAIGE